jgi:hypothetical protein
MLVDHYTNTLLTPFHSRAKIYPYSPKIYLDSLSLFQPLSFSHSSSWMTKLQIVEWTMQQILMYEGCKSGGRCQPYQKSMPFPERLH